MTLSRKQMKLSHDGYFNNLCKFCGSRFKNHNMLNAEEIEKARDRGYTVDLCEFLGERTGSFFVVVTPPPPDDPCDEDFMREIST